MPKGWDIAVADRMECFWRCKILFWSNLIKFAQILITFDQTLPKFFLKKLLGDEAAFEPARC